MKRMMSLLTACLLVMTLALPVLAAPADNPVSEAKLGVVGVFAGGIYDEHGDAIDFVDGAGSGTGFGVGLRGEDAQVFVTNHHVVDAAVKNGLYAYICIDGTDFYNEKTMIRCEILAWDDHNDYAILRTENPVKGVRTLPLLPAEEMEVGDTVFAMGYPGITDYYADESTYRVEDMTITNGIISRYLSTDGTKCMAHTAEVNHGNSGGPLINENGQIIGINTWIFQEGADLRCYANYIDYSMAALDELGLPYYTDVEEDPVVPGKKLWLEDNLVLVVAGAGAVVLLLLVVVLAGRKKKAKPNPVSPKPQNPAAQPVVLQMSAGPITGTWKLTDKLKVGRTKDCEICLPDDTRAVSRIHCLICLVDGQVQVTDLGSTYGTYVGGTRTPANRPVNVPKGGEIWIGSNNVRLTVR